MNPHTLKTYLAAPVSLAVAILCSAHAHAAAPFSENAGNSQYNSGWEDGSSQPLNFSWVTALNVPTGYAGRFLADSKSLSAGSGGDINTAGRSWGMYGSNGAESNALGVLKDGAGNNASLSVGQTLSVDIAVNWRNGYKGFAARDAAGAEIFTLNVVADDYIVFNAETGNGSIANGAFDNAYSINTVFRITMTQTSAGGGTWIITRSGGVSDVDTGTYSGVISNFKVFVGNTVAGSQNDLFVNNVSVTNATANTPVITSATRLGNGSFQLEFTALIGNNYTVLANANLDLPVSSWTALGAATETSPGQFQFADLDAPSFARRFYVVRAN